MNHPTPEELKQEGDQKKAPRHVAFDFSVAASRDNLLPGMYSYQTTVLKDSSE